MFFWTRVLRSVLGRVRGGDVLRATPVYRCPQCGEEFRVAAGEPVRCPRGHPATLDRRESRPGG